MPSVGEILPHYLEASGIRRIFGIPGVHTVELYRGLPNSRLRHITPRHEQAAGFMAHGHARAGGGTAACFVITGPGITNIATAMGQAYSDSVPMLVVSSTLARRDLGREQGRLHELRDQRGLAAGVAAWSRTVLDPDALPEIFAEANALFRSGRPRPVHIELPLDVITAEAGPPLAIPPPPNRPHPDPALIAAAAEMLAGARNPILILGGGAVDAPAPARALAEALDAPVLLTGAGKGLLPPGHPLLVGSLLSRPESQRAIRDADIVVAVGSELGETDIWRDGPLEIGGRLIRIDIDLAQLDRNARPTIGIVADAGAACTLLALSLVRRDASGATRAAQLREAGRASLSDAYRRHGRIFDRIAEALPGVILVGDSTQPVYGGAQSFDAPAPRRWFNCSSGYGTLGFALSAALGAKLARPEAPVVAVIGDGGLQYTIGELATAAELGLPLAILVWNNRGYGEIKQYMHDRGIPEIGVDILTPDFQTIARGFGLRAARAGSLDDLIARLQEANAGPGPMLVEVDEALTSDW